MLSFVPLDQGAIERCSKVLPWVWSWCGDRDIEPLTPKGWFEEGQGAVGGATGPDGIWIPKHQEGKHLWAPLPAAADVTVEELVWAHHKRPGSTHIFLCPRLMTYRWRKQLFKVADVAFEVPTSSLVWPNDMFEPLVVAVCLPFIRHRPWRLRRSPRLVGLERELRGVWGHEERRARTFLRQLLLLPGRLDSMPANVVWSMLQAPARNQVSGRHPHRQVRI